MQEILQHSRSPFQYLSMSIHNMFQDFLFLSSHLVSYFFCFNQYILALSSLLHLYLDIIFYAFLFHSIYFRNLLTHFICLLFVISDQRSLILALWRPDLIFHSNLTKTCFNASSRSVGYFLVYIITYLH